MSFKDKPLKKIVADKRVTIDAIHQEILGEFTEKKEQYHTNIEKRIDGLMAKLDAGELQMEDLTPEDRQVIIDIRMQNESGDNIK